MPRISTALKGDVEQRLTGQTRIGLQWHPGAELAGYLPVCPRTQYLIAVERQSLAGVWGGAAKDQAESLGFVRSGIDRSDGTSGYPAPCRRARPADFSGFLEHLGRALRRYL